VIDSSNQLTRLLIVDDEEVDYIVIEGLLRKIPNWDFEIEWTDYYQVAVNSIIAGHFDVCLIDYHLGEKNGLDLIKEVVSKGANCSLIIVTGKDSREIESEAMTAGAADYLVKSRIDSDRLEQAIRNSLFRKRAEEQLQRAHDDLERRVEDRTQLLRITNEELKRENLENRAVQAELQESNFRFRELAKNIQQIFWMRDPLIDQMIYVSPAYEVIFKRDSASLLAGSQQFLDAVHPDDLEYVKATRAQQPMVQVDRTFRIIQPDGTVRLLHDRSFPILDDNRAVHRIAGITEDITERQEREEQLRQAQKMEAVGLLTSGIAHDFNNMLTELTMNLNLSRRDMQDEPNALAWISEAEDTVQRCAGLTQNLVAFSRKQNLEPKSTDVACLVSNLSQLLMRTLGEMVTIETDVSDSLWPVLIDPHQLENAILNLAINARDAMENNGQLIVRCRNEHIKSPKKNKFDDIQPGDYVVMSIEDTGTGIPKDQIDKVFEPFYTTKGFGKGSGLGLSMVHGFIHQSGGSLNIESEVGVGTVVTLYLPKMANVETGEKIPPGTTESQLPEGSGEVVLVVEDRAALRRLAMRTLEELGYRVIDGGSGPDTIAIVEGLEVPVNLLLSDIVLPGGQNGLEIAKTLKARDPSLRVLLMSGYADIEFLDDARKTSGYPILQKPFEMTDFARKVNEALLS